jgi:uncharacterized membrane protein YGL010W
MRTLNSLLDEYGESHQHPLNKLIHWIAVPTIVWTVVALLWSLPFPAALELPGIPLNWATIALLLAQIYWFRLSKPLGFGLLLYNLLMIQLTVLVQNLAAWPLWKIAAAVFIGAWILQFIGHAIEGKRPSFLKDLQFLLIGPAWLLAFLYRLLGLRY